MDVPTKDEFLPVVRTCVETGRQYQINLGHMFLGQEEIRDPYRSFSYRLLKCMTDGTKRKTVPFENVPRLQDLLVKLTGGKKDSLVVVNFDGTSKVLERGNKGKGYLMSLLAAIVTFNRLQKGFVFCIMSGSNSRDLHDTLMTYSTKAPVEVPLSLLSTVHMVEILEDLANRVNKDTAQRTVTIPPESDLNVVVTALGGVPRYVEALAFRLGADHEEFNTSTYVNRLQNPPNPVQLLTEVRNTIFLQYGSVFQQIMTEVTEEIWEALVCASLFRWEINRGTKFGENTVEKLESRGIFFVTTTRDETTFVEYWTIVFPLLFLTDILPTTKGCSKLLRNLLGSLNSDENERITLTILLLKCHGLRALKKDVTVKALLPGYAANLPWRECHLEFVNKQFLREMDSQMTLEGWNEFEYQIYSSKDDGFFVNAKGTTFVDAFIIPKNSDHSILIKERQGDISNDKATHNHNTTIPRCEWYDSLVKDEHDKCNVDTQHLFILVVSDKEFEHIDLDKIQCNEIVLRRSEHEQVLEPLLALLRLYNPGGRPTVDLKRKRT